jgi:rubredoxin
MSEEEYKCEICGQIFTKGRPEGEAKAEHQQLFPDVAIEDCGLVCDTCWNTRVVPSLN